MKLTATLLVLLVFVQTPQAPPRPRPQPSAGGEPAQILIAEKAWASADVLMPLLASSDGTIRTYALRAVGRLEDPRLVPQLLALPLSPKGFSPGAVADAVAQSLKGFDPKTNPALIASVSEWMHATGMSFNKEISFQVVGAVGRIAWLTPEQVRNVEEVLLHVIDLTAQDPLYLGVYRAAMRGLESLARLNVRVAPLDDKTLKVLGESVRAVSANDSDDAVRLNAFSALVSARAVDANAETAALKDASPEIRRVAVSVLGGAGGGLNEDIRQRRIKDALADTSGLVRYE